jgi:DNA segregation ATPase FtsK/SpoIIIE, S-DNA-T family
MLQKQLRPGVGASLTPKARAVRVPLKVVLTLWALRRVTRLGWWLVTHPRSLACAGLGIGAAWAVRRYGPGWLALSVALLALALLVWMRADRKSFGRWVTDPLRARWRRLTVYRWNWEPAMTTAGLAVAEGQVLPVLGRVRCRRNVDVVRAQMCPGQTVEKWTKAAEQLAQTFGALDLRVRSVRNRPHLVELWFLTRDPLDVEVPLPTPVSSPGGLGAVACGRREDGFPLRLNLLYTHLLVVGATGSGKSSAVWSLLAGLGPGIREDWVRVLAVDPKGGMELGIGRRLFRRFAYRTDEEMCALLEDAVAAMRTRQAKYTESDTRKWQPSADEPYVVVLVDEILALMGFAVSAEVRKRATVALGVLLTQGRAVGVSVWAATQDPRKEILALRDLFPTRIALRTVNADEPDMILGRGARDRGARTDRIAMTTPGVGYVQLDGVPEPVRVRFAHVTDAGITRLVESYAPARALQAVV